MAAEAIIRHCLDGGRPAAGRAAGDRRARTRRLRGAVRAAADRHRHARATLPRRTRAALSAPAGRCLDVAAGAAARDARSRRRTGRRRRRHGRARQRTAGAPRRGGDRLSAARARTCPSACRFRVRERPRSTGSARFAGRRVRQHAGRRARALRPAAVRTLRAARVPAWRWCCDDGPPAARGAALERVRHSAAAGAGAARRCLRIRRRRPLPFPRRDQASVGGTDRRLSRLAGPAPARCAHTSVATMPKRRGGNHAPHYRRRCSDRARRIARHGPDQGTARACATWARSISAAGTSTISGKPVREVDHRRRAAEARSQRHLHRRADVRAVPPAAEPQGQGAAADVARRRLHRRHL